MKAIVNTAINRLEMQDVPLPKPKAGEVRVKVLACGICATDIEMIAGWDRTGFPSIPGHEWAGQVDAVGEDVDLSLIGKKCVAENVLKDGGEVGFEHPGGYGQYLITEARNLQILPNDFPMTTAALIEPLAVAVRGMNRLDTLDSEKPVLIIGDGPIGLLVLMLMVRRGAKEITLAGGRPYRLDLATELGASRTVNYHGKNSLLPEKHFSTIVEASGSSAAMKTAFDVMTPGGKILVLGDYKTAKADFPWNQILHREITLIGSNASNGAWPEAAKLAVEGKIPLAKLMTQRISADDFAKGIELMQSRRGDVIKVVMEW
jgi:2-desacetyl-2-hydroxyethyl bacteriochlorophyllide A dehydrogenase